MQLFAMKGLRGETFGRFLVAAVAIAVTAAAGSAAAAPALTPATLLDRAQIQDMLVDYYSQLGGGHSEFGSFYLADGILDVNGLVAQGRKPIEDLYKKIGAGTPKHPGTFRMMLTNLKITVDGQTAVADVLWTGVISEQPSAIPVFAEQGREHDELVKRDGHWLFKHRYITSDGGLQPMFEKTYKVR